MKELRQISYTKGKHTFFFNYPEGCENDILDIIIDMAFIKEHDFDWYDAASLAYQMGRKYNNYLDI